MSNKYKKYYQKNVDNSVYFLHSNVNLYITVRFSSKSKIKIQKGILKNLDIYLLEHWLNYMKKRKMWKRLLVTAIG